MIAGTAVAVNRDRPGVSAHKTGVGDSTYLTLGVSDSGVPVLESCAERFEAGRTRHARGLMEMAAALADAHSEIAKPGNGGQFGRWVHHRCGITHQHALRLIRIHEHFGDLNIDVQNFDQGSLLILAAEDTCDETRRACLSLAEEGVFISRAFVLGISRITVEVVNDDGCQAAVEALCDEARDGCRITRRVVDQILNDHLPVDHDFGPAKERAVRPKRGYTKELPLDEALKEFRYGVDSLYQRWPVAKLNVFAEQLENAAKLVRKVMVQK